MASREELAELLEPGVNALGYELADLEVNVGRGRGLIRLFIDREDGITLEDCERVSHQVSGILDVEDPIKDDYVLEVSSPGLDRRLVKTEHFERFRGSRIKVRLRRLVDGRRRLSGKLVSNDEQTITVEAGDGERVIPREEIETVRLVPEV